MKERSLEVGKLKWFYREAQPQQETEKPPILFLHGLPSHSLCWCEVMEKVTERGWRAIAPDWIGSGFSAKPERRDFAYTPEAYSNAFEEFLAALEIEKFILVVQGYLSTVGLQYIFANPDRCDRVVILNAPLVSTAQLPWSMKQWGIPFVGDMLTQDPLLVDRTLEGGSGFRIADKNLDIYRKPFLQTSAVGRALMTTVRNLNLPKVTAQLEESFANWTKPTLIIWGSADSWLPEAPVENLAATHENIKLIKLPEAKHYPQEHWPEEVSQALLNFL
ncbi:alpha/beta fold hydrolase [Oscillatoria sp. FACHB-1406]|nr:alpha/beta fold hydrolase [Oscillatoria sp. FACHB-1406]